jgi:hypothetical protein
MDDLVVCPNDGFDRVLVLLVPDEPIAALLVELHLGDLTKTWGTQNTKHALP